jgi:hypothetical protein
MTKKNIPPQWRKRRGSFTYEIADPVAGGLWIYEASRKMSNEELDQRIYSVVVIGRQPRPKRGQTALLRPQGDD